MTERAFPTEADRRALIAIRASALRRLIEPLPMRSGEQKIRLVQELMSLAQNSDTMALPRARRVRSELDIQVVEHDPAVDGEPRTRVLDLLEILEARRWPLPWYAVASHPLDAPDRSQIAALVAAFVAAAAARDEAAAMALYATEGERLEFSRRWFQRHVCDAQARIEQLDGYSVNPRFDGRRALIGGDGRPPLRLSTADGVRETVSLSVVRAHGGWQLG